MKKHERSGLMATALLHFLFIRTKGIEIVFENNEIGDCGFFPFLCFAPASHAFFNVLLGSFVSHNLEDNKIARRAQARKLASRTLNVDVIGHGTKMGQKRSSHNA